MYSLWFACHFTFNRQTNEKSLKVIDFYYENSLCMRNVFNRKIVVSKEGLLLLNGYVNRVAVFR